MLKLARFRQFRRDRPIPYMSRAVCYHLAERISAKCGKYRGGGSFVATAPFPACRALLLSPSGRNRRNCRNYRGRASFVATVRFPTYMQTVGAARLGRLYDSSVTVMTICIVYVCAAATDTLLRMCQMLHACAG